jgi:hypothetical protein
VDKLSVRMKASVEIGQGMPKTIKEMSDRRIVEKLNYYRKWRTDLEGLSVNVLFDPEYKKAASNYHRYLREWGRRELDKPQA